MTVTFHDPQSPARLPSRNEVLDFDVDSDLTAFTASLRYPNGHMETIYQAGLWGLGYRSSTLVGTTFHVVRTGGWPRGSFDLPMTEAPLVSGGLAWGLLYSVDFSTLTPASYVTAGAQVLDGLTWYLKGTFTQGGGVIHSSDLDATGLRIRSNFGSEGTNNTNLRWWLPLANVPGFNASAPVVVFGRMTTTAAGSTSHCILGFCEGTADSSSLTLTQRGTRMGCGARESLTTAMTSWVGDVTASVGLTATATTARVDGVCLTSSRVGVLTSRPWTNHATYIDPYLATDLTTSGAVGYSATAINTAALGIHFAHNFNGGSTQDFYLRNLYIYQPLAP